MQEELRADAKQADRPNTVLETVQEHTGPPEAKLKRRAQSYSDFHDVVKAVLGKDAVFKESRAANGEQQIEPKPGIKNELDFVDWYHQVEHELLESSSNDYV